ncbi:hypothetical protein [Lewinella cohaerens]|uniref:hypothetical protein n=1 Tax=Lewinella cohaerens TaxID=70995 RepID=UPI00036CA9AD|nr:hypothetical protein [Lewinella cohaerens]
MPHPQKIKSIHSNQHRSLLVIGVLLCGFLGIILSKDLFTKKYVDGIDLVMSLFFFAFALMALNYLINRKVFELSSKRIILKTKLRRKVFPASTIQGFKEETYQEKHQSGRRLVFKMGNKFLTIDSNSYANFYEIVGFARQHFRKLEDQEFKRYEFLKNLPFQIILFTGAIFFLGFFIKTQFDEIDDLEKDLHYTEMTLASTPVVESSSGKGNKHYIPIHTVEYPEFEFKINGFRYQACNTNLTDELQAGDKVRLGLKQEDFRSKIGNLAPPSFQTKHFHWDMIWVYQLSHEGREYINLDQAKRLMNKNQKWSWVLLVMGLFALSVAVVPWGRSRS